MKISFILLLLLLLIGCSKGPAIDDQTYPWQIKITATGNSQVFGIELDKSPLGHAARVLNKHYELGLFEDKHGRLSLEAYFNELTRGGLSGKLIVLLKADQQQLQLFRSRSVKGKPQESGVLKYTLTSDDMKLSEQLVVSSLSYIPYVNLDEEMVHKRFGVPGEVIKSKDGLTHYLYLKKGLDIIHSEDGKEILQYVPPGNIKQLLQPLKNQ